jgi:hypothetical protein
VSFQIVPLPVVINCRTSGDESYKSQKIFLGIFKQETNISAITIAPAYSFHVSGWIKVKVPEGSTPTLSHILSSQKKRNDG